MKKLLLSFLCLMVMGFPLLADPTVTKTDNTLTIDFTPAATFQTSGQTVSSFEADGLTFTCTQMKWQKSTSNSYLAFQKNASAALTFPAFSRPVESIQVYWKNTNKSKFTLSAGETEIKTFGGNSGADAWSTSGEYTCAIPSASQAAGTIYKIVTANTANVCGIGKITITFGEAGPADANAKFENIICKKDDVRDIVYTPADLGTVSYDIPAEADSYFTITGNTLTALKVGGPFTVTASWGEGNYKAGTAEFTVTVEGNVSNPTFEPAEAEINVGTPVKLATTDEAALYYAVLEGLDATVPETQEFTAYPADGILLKAGEFTVAAYGELDGEKSPVVTHSYTVNKLDAGISFPEKNYIAYISEGFTMPELANVPEGFPVDKITYTSSNPDVASVEAATGAIELLTEGETEIHAIFAGDDTYSRADAYFSLTVFTEKPETAVFDFTTAADADGKGAYGMTVFGFGTAAGSSGYEENVKTCTEGDVTLTFDPESESITSDYRIWKASGGNELRIQGSTKFSITAPAGKIITKIEFSKGANMADVIPGTYTGGQVHTWEPDENVYTNVVNFTTGTSQIQLYQVTVTLSDAPVPAIPEILADGTAVTGDGYRAPETAETVEISFGEVPAGVSIWYRFTEAAAAMAVADEAEEAPFTKYKAAFTLDKPGTLEYYVQDDKLGSKSDIKRLTVSIPTGIDGIGADETEAEYYDLNGRRIAGQPEQGICLRKAAGKVQKVIIR